MKRSSVIRVAMVLFATARPLFLLPALFAATPLRTAPLCSPSGGQAWGSLEESHSLSSMTSLILLDEIRTNCGGASTCIPISRR